ncbi:hypothetical protein ACFYZJ_00130 [Streptomyces sp. NPDC001848]|uniref:hypothetical protein n=1 Tax=Streptomyces sp. NPDC001848 TaxID=3364618 RepID=UPI0036BAD9AE
MFLWIVFHRPGGGACIRFAWTDRGSALGERIDQLALASAPSPPARCRSFTLADTDAAWLLHS